MSRRSFFGSRDVRSYERSSATSDAEKATGEIVSAWRSLARAGAPRTARSDRDRFVASARESTDAARGFLTDARIYFHRLAAEVDRAERAWNARPASQRDNYYRPDSSKKAGVTQLRPVIERLTADVATLCATLAKYRNGDCSRLGKAYELEVARRQQPMFSSTVVDLRRCNWCGKTEERYSLHYALDGQGYGVAREEGRKFACSSCMWDGRDLAEPNPKPLPDVVPSPAPSAGDVVDAEVVGDAPRLTAVPKQLPPAPSKQLPAPGGSSVDGMVRR